MCQNTNDLIFCTCKDSSNIFRRNKGEYSWSLSKLVGIKTYKPGEPRIIGKIRIPNKNLGKGINAENILQELNSRDCFDFEYIPQEMDCLTITGDNGYFKVRFKTGFWEIGRHPAFSSISEPIDSGKVGIMK